MPLTIPSIFTAVDRLSPVTRAMASGVEAFANRASAAMQRADRAVNRFTSVLSHAQKEIFAFLSVAAMAAAIVGSLEFGFDGIKEYDKAITKLQGRMALSDAAFMPFRNAVVDTARDTYKSVAEVADSFDIIGSKLQDIKFNPAALREVSTAAIELSEAFMDKVAPTTTNLVNILSAFKLPAAQAGEAINIIAAASASGAVKGNALAEAIGGMAAAAKSHNVSLAQTAALIQIVDKATNLGAAGAGGLEKSFIKLQKVNGAYKSGVFNLADALDAVNKHLHSGINAKRQDAVITDLFGKKNAIAGRALVENAAQFQSLTAAITGTEAAKQQAAQNAKSFEVIWERVKNSFINTIVSANDTNKAFGYLKTGLTYLYKHMDRVLNIAGLVIAAFFAWKAIMMLTSITMVGFNIALGVMGALTNVASVAIGKNAVALAAYKITTGLATAATWAWGAALEFGLWPLTLIALAIGAIIFVVYEVIKHWNSWGSAITAVAGILGLFFSPVLAAFAFMISLVMSFRRNWDMIVDAFTNKGFLSGLWAIGKTIFDAILQPMQSLLEMIAKITGANWAANMAKGIDKFRGNMGLNIATDGSAAGLAHEAGVEPNPALLNPQKDRQDQFVRSINESTTNSNKNITVDFKNLPAGVNVTGDGAADMMPKVGSTMRFDNAL